MYVYVYIHLCVKKVEKKLFTAVSFARQDMECKKRK